MGYGVNRLLFSIFLVKKKKNEIEQRPFILVTDVFISEINKDHNHKQGE